MSDEKFVDDPPGGAAAWRDVWVNDRRYRPRPGRHEWLVSVMRRLVRRAEEPDASRQNNFNVAVLEMLGDLRQEVEAVRRDLRGDFTTLQRDMIAADEANAAQINTVLPISARRNDALIAALDQKIETLAVRLRDLTTPLLQQSFKGERAGADFLYRRLEDGLRGSETEIRAAMQPYVDRARDHQPAIDVGCGRGEFLVLCREAGIQARGFDTNERSVADLAARGLDVGVAGIPGCFEGIADASIGSILATHVVEHIPAEILFALFTNAARVLRPGGLLMIETPNAESLMASASEFWRDPTHLAPRHPAALTLLAREYGFAVDEMIAIHPFPEGTALPLSADDPPAVQRIVEAINRRLFAPQDLRMIFRK